METIITVIEQEYLPDVWDALIKIENLINEVKDIKDTTRKF